MILESSMKLVSDNTEPELIGIVTDTDDVKVIDEIVQSLNKDLIDSGFDEYQYSTVRRGNKIYVERN